MDEYCENISKLAHLVLARFAKDCVLEFIDFLDQMIDNRLRAHLLQPRTIAMACVVLYEFGNHDFEFLHRSSVARLRRFACAFAADEPLVHQEMTCIG